LSTAAVDTFVPGSRIAPGFDTNFSHFDASAAVHRCSSSRRSPVPLTAGLFP